MILENKNMIVEIDEMGGSYTDFHLKAIPINPINWRSNGSQEASFTGHFLCFDRWGPPSEGEKANGFLHHGEANSEKWELLDPQMNQKGSSHASMRCILPMGALQLTRKIKTSRVEPLFHVTEEIKNLNKFGRMYNIVQHVSIAPPFLDKSTIFDTNAEKGFENKEDGGLNQEEHVYYWHESIHNGEKVNFRQFEQEWPRVSSFLFNKTEEYAWVTACNPEKNLLLGYIWKTEEYPWINFWRSMENGIPMAFGMEFGTTGLHEPFPIVAKKAKIFGTTIYDYIDANEVITKSFTAFLAKIPADYKGVDQINMNHSSLIIKEKNIISRDINYKINL